MKKRVAIVMTICMLMSSGVTTEASWLLDTLKKVNNTLESMNESLGAATGPQINSSSSQSEQIDPKSSRWVKISENKYFATYADKRSVKAEGEAQHRWVGGYFKREFTPLGSQWLGEQSGGAVKPNVITHSIYEASYGPSYGGSIRPNDVKYYDVHGNLIYKGALTDWWNDFRNSEYQRYTPDSEQERIKDILFHAFGWDY